MLTYHTVTSPGSRPVNEDCIGHTRVGLFGRCFCLADGLGGHDGGELASKVALDSFLRSVRSSPDDLGICFDKAQEAVLDLQKTSGGDMKTTFTAVKIIGNKLSFAHIGDSRIYVIRGSSLLRRTKDHSVPQMLVSLGEITYEEIRHHPDRSRLLSVIGEEWTKPRYSIDEVDMPLEDGDRILMCSDGFWEYLPDEIIIDSAVSADNPHSWLRKLTEIVENSIKGRSSDNYSAIAVMYRKYF